LTRDAFGSVGDVIGVNPDDYLIDDDQYNIVLIEKKSMRPLYAVEYGANN